MDAPEETGAPSFFLDFFFRGGQIALDILNLPSLASL